MVSMVEQPDEELIKQKDIKFTSQFTQVTTERLTKVAELVDAGKLTVNVDQVFPLDKTADAMQHLTAGHPRGKVVIQIKE